MRKLLMILGIVFVGIVICALLYLVITKYVQVFDPKERERKFISSLMTTGKYDTITTSLILLRKNNKGEKNISVPILRDSYAYFFLLHKHGAFINMDSLKAESLPIAIGINDSIFLKDTATYKITIVAFCDSSNNIIYPFNYQSGKFH